MSELLLIGDPDNVWATIHMLRQRIEILEAKVKDLDQPRPVRDAYFSVPTTIGCRIE